MTTERKPAPEEVMLVGYWLTEARTTLLFAQGPYGGSSLAYGFAYLTSAVQAVPDARESLKRDLENRQMLPSDGLYDIRVACRQLQKLVGTEYVDPMVPAEISDLIGRGHQKLARMLFRLGYAPITDDDFKKLARLKKLPGGGGGR